MKTLYLLCGLLFSGKTTLARKIVERRRLLRSPPPSQWSDHGGHRWRLRSGGAQAGMVRSDRGQKRRRSFGGKMRAKYPRQSVLGSFKPTTRNRRRLLWELMKLQGMQENQ